MDTRKQDTARLIEEIVLAIEDKKGKDIVSLDLSGFDGAICSHFVVCHADSTTQVAGIAAGVEQRVLEKLGEKPWRIEGEQNALWIAIDYTDVMVHIFQRELREYYRLEELWVKSAERMGQAGILRVVDQFMGHLMSAQSLFKIQSIALKIIVVTGDQETGWQAGHDVRVLRRYIGGKSTFFIMPAVEISGEEKSDLIQAVRIEHTADQTKCPDWQVRRGYSGSLCQCSASLHGDSISQQTGTAAVAAGIYVGNVTAVFRQMIPDKIQCQMQVCQLVIEETVRYQPVLNAEYQIPRLTKGGTKGTVELLVPYEEASAMYVDDDRENLSVPSPGTVDIQTTCRNMLLVIENIRL